MGAMMQDCPVCNKEVEVSVIDDYTNKYGLVYKKCVCSICKNELKRSSIEKYNKNLDKITENFFKGFDEC